MVKRARPRTPLTITLNPESYEFVRSCAELKQFRCVDELFEAALALYRKHTHALVAYTEMQQDKGFTREEILRSLECEFLFTRPLRDAASIRRNWS